MKMKNVVWSAIEVVVGKVLSAFFLKIRDNLPVITLFRFFFDPVII